MKGLEGSKFSIEIKFYNGVYTDNWILLNINLDLNDIKDALLIKETTLQVASTINAKLSMGKYFEVLLEKSCKVENILMDWG